jgi:hypothetical protein
MIAESLNIPKTVVLRNLKEDLGKKVVCMFCSTLLDTRAKGRSSHIWPRHYRDGLSDKIFFNKIVTGNEAWCFAYDPETR